MNLFHRIMILLILLVALFSAGIAVMSYLNINYSRAAMSELRQRQIREVFYANLERIYAHHLLMEKNARELAALGEMFYRLRRLRQDDALQAELATAVSKKIQNFPETFGGGLWYEPYAYQADSQYFSAYAYWKKNQVVLDRNEAGAEYHQEEWYRAAIPADWKITLRRPQELYWTPAHFNLILETAVITLAAPMYGDSGQLIGIATTDWSFDDIRKLISEVTITDNSFAFLIDEKNRKFNSLTEEKRLSLRALTDALSVQEFAGYTWPGLDDSRQMQQPQTRELRVEGRDYLLYFTKTRAGMIFGISVPKDEIYSAIEAMRDTNLKIVLGMMLGLLLLAGIILYAVYGIMRLLDTLYTDRLTGLPNRTKLLQDLKNFRGGALVLININDFKQLNDFYGHACGDFVLREFGRRITAYLPRLLLSKGVSGAVLYRLPADEFAVVLPGVTTSEFSGAGLHQFFNYASMQKFQYADQEISFEITAGVAMDHSEQPGQLGETLLASANMALDSARKQNQKFLVYDASMQIREEYQHNLEWAKKLKQSLEQDRVVPYFQPILNNATQTIEKYECLVRIIDEKGNAVLPGEFLNVAKKLQIYPETTQTMIEKSFAVFREVEGDFSINLSYQDILNEQTTEFIKTKLDESGLGPRVVFEILESEGIQNYEKVHDFVQAIKQRGGKIAIDDFGSGYSNFEHLLQLDADFIKIDGSLIKNIHTDRNALIVTHGIVSFAKRLNLKTIAEYVHCREVFERVCKLGIDYSQGYYISPPQPSIHCPLAPEFVKLPLAGDPKP
jgi:diguanylate cyclase (GGDEF)-like protein